MNSLYGKMAASQSRDIVKELTTNSTLILNMAKTGLLEQCDEIKFDGSDKTFYQIGGIQETSTKNVNMMVGAFTTAYGRIKLNQIQRDVLKHGFRLLYSDTDSVYFEVGEHMTTNSQINTAMDTLGKIQCHKTQIGMSKYETADDVGNCLQITNLHKQSDDENLRYSYADQGVFLAPKSYAIRSTTTG